jgi:hypothetical protein
MKSCGAFLIVEMPDINGPYRDRFTASQSQDCNSRYLEKRKTEQESLHREKHTRSMNNQCPGDLPPRATTLGADSENCPWVVYRSRAAPDIQKHVRNRMMGPIQHYYLGRSHGTVRARESNFVLVHAGS